MHILLLSRDYYAIGIISIYSKGNNGFVVLTKSAEYKVSENSLITEVSNSWILCICISSKLFSFFLQCFLFFPLRILHTHINIFYLWKNLILYYFPVSMQLSYHPYTPLGPKSCLYVSLTAEDRRILQFILNETLLYGHWLIYS